MSSLSSVFSTAISGLNASDTSIDVTGNNVANADTVGFKSSDALFATQFAQTLGLGTGPSGTDGGTDPTQTGLGVEVTAIVGNFSQGSLETTSTPSDLAIQGNGFFTVEASNQGSANSSAQQSQAQNLYTRNGQFQLNSENQLTTSTGQLLLGYGVNSGFEVTPSSTLTSLSIPLGTTTVAKATANVQMQGTLTSSGSLATSGQIQDSPILGDASFTAPPAGTLAAAADIPVIVQPTTTDDATVPAGQGVSPSTTYTYEAVFVDASTGTQSTPSAPITVTTGAGDNEVVFNNLPSDPNYSELALYREDSSGAFKLVTTLPTSTTSYNDTMPDATLASEPASDTLNTTTLTGDYSYYVTYSTANNTESRPSPLVGPVNVVNGRIQLTDIPSSTDPTQSWSNINIYRNTTSNPSQFQLIATLPNTSGQSYTDDTPDSTLASATSSTGSGVIGHFLNMNGPAASASTLLTNVLIQTSTGSTQLFPGGTLTFTPEKGQSTLSAQTFTIHSTSTVGDLTYFMSQAAGIQSGNGIPNDSSGATPGVSINGQGQIVIVSNNGTNDAVSTPLGALTLTTSGVTQEVPISFTTAQQAVGTGASANFVVYDSLGTAINVTVTAELQSESASGTTYRWFADSAGNEPTTTAGDGTAAAASIAVGTGLITFNSNGTVQNGATGQVSIDRNQSAATSPMLFNLDFSQVSGLAATSASLAASSQDGFPPGKLTSYNIGSDGTITGVFDNGTQRSLGQVVLTNFANPQGLVQQGQNLYAAGPNSGLPITTAPSQDGAGSIVSGALEQSNTDIGQSLIELITASTGYQGNAKVIQTANSLLQDLLQLNGAA